MGLEYIFGTWSFIAHRKKSKFGSQTSSYPFLQDSDLWMSLRACFHESCSVFFLPCNVLKPDFCFPVSPEAYIFKHRVYKVIVGFSGVLGAARLSKTLPATTATFRKHRDKKNTVTTTHRDNKSLWQQITVTKITVKEISGIPLWFLCEFLD